MTQTLTFHPKFGIRIPAETLREAGFQPKKTFIINIIPQHHEEAAEEDWFDEVLETTEGRAYFKARVREAEREYRQGKLHDIEDVFAEIDSERKQP